MVVPDARSIPLNIYIILLAYINTAGACISSMYLNLLTYKTCLQIDSIGLLPLYRVALKICYAGQVIWLTK
ncbi:hypothetical protein AK825_02440 [Psychrobacter sp. P11G5]|nr:hypothetical protein AK825_02440 [Psychrobacter sp. P11G5]